MEGTLLCIDDEPSVLKSLRRTLMTCVDDILLASSGEEAIELLKSNPVDLVMCDMRMPEMDGYQTLSIVRDVCPKATRLILSGYTTKDVMLKTVLDGTASIYIQKPWGSKKLQEVVTHLLAVRNTLDQDGLQDIFSSMDSLPALPRLYQKVVEMIGQEKTVEEIGEMIEHEPAYVARILRMANSAIHGVSIGSVSKATVYLGLNTIKNIILTCEIFDNLQGKNLGPYGVESLWIHSNICNLALGLLHQHLYKTHISNELASVGLLHDIGKFLMIKYYSDACMEIESKLEEHPEKMVCDVEREVLGVSHSEIGGLLLDWWNLPSNVVEGCLYHHAPLDDNVLNKKWVALLRIADYLAWSVQGEKTPEPLQAELDVVGATAETFNNPEILDALNKAKDSLAGLV